MAPVEPTPVEVEAQGITIARRIHPGERGEAVITAHGPERTPQGGHPRPAATPGMEEGATGDLQREGV